MRGGHLRRAVDAPVEGSAQQSGRPADTPRGRISVLQPIHNARMSLGSHARHACAALLALLLSSAVGAQVDPGSPGAIEREQAKALAFDRMTAKVAREGRARVIVKLATPTLPAEALTAADASTRRSAIRAAQDALEAEALSGTQARVVGRFKNQPHMAIEVDDVALAKLRASGRVLAVEEDVVVKPSLDGSVRAVTAPQAWSAGFTGKGQVVAVLDTGVDRNHPFLMGRVVSEACYSSNYTGYTSLCPGGVTQSTALNSAAACTDHSGCAHGTHVAGIAAGSRGPNGMRGVAPAARIIAVQVFSKESETGEIVSFSSDLIRALERVHDLRTTYRIAAVNMSLAGGTYGSYCDSEFTAVKEAIDSLRAVGIATVVAAGNDAERSKIGFPACISSAISVGATDNARGVIESSNVASFLTLTAPGHMILSSIPGGSYIYYTGTSMAAPHVAGAIALVRQARPAISVTNATSLLRTNAAGHADTRLNGVQRHLRGLRVGFLKAGLFDLSVGRSGTGVGRVTSSSVGIACGSDCRESYTAGTMVTLNPLPRADSYFAGWTGACTGMTACTLSMTEARTVRATFNLR